MTADRFLAAVLATMAVAVPVAQAPGVRTFDDVRAAVGQVQAMRGVVELRVRWTLAQVQGAAEPRERSTFALVRSRVRSGTLRRERRPELSAERLVVVALDVAGRELDWRFVPNPRLLRAELPGPDGLLSGRTIDAPPSEFDLALPDLPGLDRVNVYQPRLTAEGYVLDLLGTCAVTTRGPR